MDIPFYNYPWVALLYNLRKKSSGWKINQFFFRKYIPILKNCWTCVWNITSPSWASAFRIRVIFHKTRKPEVGETESTACWRKKLLSSPGLLFSKSGIFDHRCKQVENLGGRVSQIFAKIPGGGGSKLSGKIARGSPV